MGVYNRIVKRGLDVAMSSAGLVVLSVPMLGICAAIKIEDKGPAIFKQDRIGKDGKVYKMYKFRSMKENSEHSGSGVYSNSSDSRVTKVGKFLRATSLDELPQLVNMFKGDMSLIGPRPPLTYHPWTFDKYTDHQKRMFEVRPGLTGWAQINGRRAVEWNNRIEMNVWYVDNESFLLDLEIFFKTIGKVLCRKDNENHGATVQTGDGSETPAREEDM